MASQAAIFAETIAGMKKAIKRKLYDSESDSSIEQLTNRGNKLRKKARFVHEGQLAPPTGPNVYKRKIEHAGFYRDIISQNPPLIDEEGYEVDSDDDDERAQIAMTSAAEFDPYADVKIDQLLMPLTAASDLPDHLTLSKPFTSRTLTELTQNAREMVQKEKASLWRIKHLLTRLSGDNTWIPCESLVTDNDIALFLDVRDKNRATMLGRLQVKDDADQASTGTLVSDDAEQPPNLLNSEGHISEPPQNTMQSATSNPIENGDELAQARNGTIGKESTGQTETNKTIEPRNSTESHDNLALKNGARIPLRNDFEPATEENVEMGGAVKPPSGESSENQGMAVDEITELDVVGSMEELGDNAAPRRMRTRAQAQAASDNTASSRTRSATPEFNNDTFIHPYFLAPITSHPDRDVGLPQPEAEETRRLLQLYIQKQEEVCRGAQKIYEGLLRADRYRKLVLKWAKAEAHVGVNRDMSDGEDWYDKGEWGLDEDLKKGQDEEEEDAATTAKKTRTLLRAKVREAKLLPNSTMLIPFSEYHNKVLTKLAGGNSRNACYGLAVAIFSLGIFRDFLYERALRAQPSHPALENPLASYIAYALLATGNVLVLSSMWALGVTGTYLGDYFGILMDKMVMGFPFNICSAPMYYGSTMSFLGTAILFGKPAGILLTAEVLVVYMIALRFEDPFTAGIYAKREKDQKKGGKKA
ncbi:hypothetical protein G7Y89_g4065 [Cudoniella acicularis]|uniref:Phosphatidyl-N-methylethanolamine N-methyltransferase n=1 Tax=Cudoniella acicularis TaxID=354080 RepID=A0A8H4RSC0_9HELO|nr:hypothetical protein G7Y89_g4065 [Cudoniella acicularis]